LLGAYDELMKKTSPEFSENDNLSDWISDLAEIEGTVAGLAFSKLGGRNKTIPNLKKEILNLKIRIEGLNEEFSEDDQTIYSDCLSYFEIIERIANLLD
jgi:hypothetical protein